MNAESFFRAAVPEPFTVLGLRLRPFSAGHLILLHRIESAFAVGGIPQLSDLVSSVFICSLNHEEGVASLESDEVPKMMAEWQSKIGHFDFVDKCRLFARYIREGSEGPNYFTEQQGGSINAPEVQIVKCKLMSAFGMSEREFLDRPWAMSLWDYCTLYAIEGSISFIDKESIEEAQSIADALAEKLNRKADPCQN